MSAKSRGRQVKYRRLNEPSLSILYQESRMFFVPDYFQKEGFLFVPLNVQSAHSRIVAVYP